MPACQASPFGLFPAREEIAARLDEERREPGALEHGGGAVDRVALRDAAEADAYVPA